MGSCQAPSLLEAPLLGPESRPRVKTISIVCVDDVNFFDVGIKVLGSGSKKAKNTKCMRDIGEIDYRDL